MAEQYVHTLIPRDRTFTPTPEQIICFADGLSALGAEPLNRKLTLVKPSGRMRAFKDPMTGETRTIPANERIPLERTADLASAIGNLQQYFVALDGEGPPPVPPFPVYFEDEPTTQPYGFVVRCCLEAEPVSMSCLGVVQTGRELPFFGRPCQRQDASFRHPVTGEMVEVVNVGCARFWVEFEFGKWLLPKIHDSLNILDPRIAEMADHAFSVGFAQGFHLF